jgi:hypothetical protein
MPSSAMFTTPERSQMVPPMAAKASGVAILIAEAKRSGVMMSLSMLDRLLLLCPSNQPLGELLGCH